MKLFCSVPFHRWCQKQANVREPICPQIHLKLFDAFFDTHQDLYSRAGAVF